jgi:uncharacterized membrane protein
VKRRAAAAEAVPLCALALYHLSLLVEPLSGLGLTDHAVPSSAQAWVAEVETVSVCGLPLVV